MVLQQHLPVFLRKPCVKVFRRPSSSQAWPAALRQQKALNHPAWGGGQETLKLLGDFNKYLALQAFCPESQPQMQAQDWEPGFGKWLCPGHREGPERAPVPQCPSASSAEQLCPLRWPLDVTVVTPIGSVAQVLLDQARSIFFLWHREILRFTPIPERKHQSCRVANGLFL